MLSLLLCTGLLGGYSLTLFKLLGELVVDKAYNSDLWLCLLILTLGLTANLLQLLFLNISMKYYDQLDVVPIFMTSYLVFGIFCGMIFLAEYTAYSKLNFIGIAIGISFCVAGITLLVMKNKKVKTDALSTNLDEQDSKQSNLVGQRRALLNYLENQKAQDD